MESACLNPSGHRRGGRKPGWGGVGGGGRRPPENVEKLNRDRDHKGRLPNSLETQDGEGSQRRFPSLWHPRLSNQEDPEGEPSSPALCLQPGQLAAGATGIPVLGIFAKNMQEEEGKEGNLDDMMTVTAAGFAHLLGARL